MPGAMAASADDEHLACAALALVCDGADPVMNAVLSVSGAMQLWSTLHEESDRAVDGILALALPQKDERAQFEADPRRTVAWRTHIREWVNRAAGIPSRLDDLWERLTDSGALHILIPSDRLWPQRVEDLGMSQEFPDPLCLWVRGDPSCLTKCCSPLAIVGSREADRYGLQMAREAATAAAKAGHTVISGGAMGIDAAAHRAAVETASASTIAVMAGGLNHAGPARNLELFGQIVDTGGALISEVAPDTAPVAWRFLIRNRLIAALAHTVLVAQARYRSGALNTATHAARLNRVVLAMPGDADRAGNAGCNDLIYQGKAILLPDPRNVLDMLPDKHDHRGEHGTRKEATANGPATVTVQGTLALPGDDPAESACDEARLDATSSNAANSTTYSSLDNSGNSENPSTSNSDIMNAADANRRATNAGTDAVNTLAVNTLAVRTSHATAATTSTPDSDPDAFPAPADSPDGDPFPGLFPDPNEDDAPGYASPATPRNAANASAAATQLKTAQAEATQGNTTHDGNHASHRSDAQTSPTDASSAASSSTGLELDDAIVRAVRMLRRSHRPADIGSVQAHLQRHGTAGVTCRRLAVRLGALELEGRVLRHADGTFAALE